MGYLRFVLAVMVALSHMDMRWEGLNPGVMAVVGFYLVSGMSMAALWHGTYRPQLPVHGRFKVTMAFYADRLLRIWPAYLAVLGLSAATYFYCGINSPFISRVGTGLDWLNQLLIIPLNWFAWNDSDHFVFIPPAWSLGAELQFYLLVPFVMSRARLWGFALSLGVALAAASGHINSDLWGYRLLPGVLLIFILGSGLAIKSGMQSNRWLWVTLASVPVVMSYQHTWHLPYSREIMIGVVVGSLAIKFCRHYKWPGNAYFGALAYPFFLCHFWVKWMLEHYQYGQNYLLFLLLTLLLSAWIVFLVEFPMQQIRYRIRSYLINNVA